MLNATSRSDGTFNINQVTPGEYQLVARGRGECRPRSRTPAGGIDDAGTGLRHSCGRRQTCRSVEARHGGGAFARTGANDRGEPPFFQRDPTGTDEPHACAHRVAPAACGDGCSGSSVTSLGFVPPTKPARRRILEIAGIGPGTYRLMVSGLGTPRWWPQSALFAGRDLFDTDIEITSGTAAGRLEVLFSDRQAEVSGSTRDGNRITRVQPLRDRVPRRSDAVGPGLAACQDGPARRTTDASPSGSCRPATTSWPRSLTSTRMTRRIPRSSIGCFRPG